MDHKTPIFRSIAIIEERIHEKLTVETLANSIHFSRFHYQRLFREVVGESVMRYVTRRRLSLAAEDLAKTDASILYIALKYGYDSHEGFTRSFHSYMGVTPSEYRKYHLSVSISETQKEEYRMSYSKNTDEIIRELNSLIVQARETAEFTRKARSRESEGASYSLFWDLTAQRSEQVAAKIQTTLHTVSVIAQHPDEISSRFLIIKAIEDAAFWSSVTAFQTGLMMARAQPACHAAFDPICEKYQELSRNARICAVRIVPLFDELSELIFQDMRACAAEKLQRAAKQGKTAAAALWDDALPYAYIAEELTLIAGELAAVPLDDTTVSSLEDMLFRLDIILFAADMDTLRTPSHKSLFEGILKFKKALGEVLAFFQSLSSDLSDALRETVENPAVPVPSPDKLFRDAAFQGNILLFYLKGEVQKLGSRYLDAEQKAAFGTLCGRLKNMIYLSDHARTQKDFTEVVSGFRELSKEMTLLAENLGAFGAPVQYIAEEMKALTTRLKGNPEAES